MTLVKNLHFLSFLNDKTYFMSSKGLSLDIRFKLNLRLLISRKKSFRFLNSKDFLKFIVLIRFQHFQIWTLVNMVFNKAFLLGYFVRFFILRIIVENWHLPSYCGLFYSISFGSWCFFVHQVQYSNQLYRCRQSAQSEVRSSIFNHLDTFISFDFQVKFLSHFSLILGQEQYFF